MNTAEGNSITVETNINASLEDVWKKFTHPEDIIHWNFASDDWHAPNATNDLKVGGKFSFNMAAKDGSFAFDFEGIYDKVIPNTVIEYSIIDGRKVKIYFSSENGLTKVVETFDAENENSLELQRGGWQAILNNFKKYVEKA